MFATIILGIGFIMVAGIFPVSLQQAKQSTEEVTGSAVARAATNVMTEFFTNSGNTILRATGIPPVIFNLDITSPGAGWDSLRGNMIVSEDPRFGWTVLYRRVGTVNASPQQDWAPFAQVYIIPLASRVADQFTAEDTKRQTFNDWPNLCPKQVDIKIQDDVLEAGGVDLIAIGDRDGAATKDRFSGAAVEGAYVIVAFDNNTNRLNGNVYRLGARRADMDFYFSNFSSVPYVFELQPGSDFKPDPGPDEILGNADDLFGIGVQTPTANPGIGWIVGRGYADPVNPDPDGDNVPNFDGGNMALGVYSTFVKINK